ncbi:MAG: EAL domain-containing protein [Geobacteraceae bacterium]|nr:EAL domain-containing protein [Geobacteraceae bacterium]
MKSVQSVISRITTGIAVVLAILVTLIIPAGYFGLNYQNINGKLDAEAEINARLVAHLITDNPDLWQYENLRLDELLSRRPSKGNPEIRRIMDTKGAVIASNGTELAAPVISKSHIIYDSGRPVAQLQIHTTLAPLLIETGLMALIGFLIGIALFMTLHMLPVKMARRAEQALKQNSEFLSKVMDNNTSGLVVLNPDGTISLCNRRFARLCGVEESLLLGQHLVNAWITDTERENLNGKLEALAGINAEAVEFDTELTDSNGTVHLLTCGAARVRGDAAESEIVISVEDITHRRESESRIRQMAHYDNLTNLPNRALFSSETDRAIAYSKRYNTVFGLMVLDIDNFKRINDTLGHHFGDLLLQRVAERLVSCVRKSDYLSRPSDEQTHELVARLGGDEFTILLTSFNRDEDAAKVANRIIGKMSAPFRIDGQEIFATISIGIATYPGDGDSREMLFKNADTAMYHAKSAGRNTYNFYRKTMNDSALKRLNLENSLHKALERNEFQLYYQPRIDSKTGEMHGAEALIRWNHPDLGIVNPGEFISIAEENGLIIPMTEWVLQEVCSQSRLWQQSGLQKLKVSINISCQIFKQRDLPGLIAQALEKTGLDANTLEIEITESLMLNNVDTTIKILKQVREMGIEISIDDFGTGYSSFSYLTQLPVNAIKIDRSFVMNLPHRQEDCAIVKAIIATSHSLGLITVAEGVETAGQSEFLAENGCNEFQGYLFSRPLPAVEFEKLMRKA